MDRIGNRRCWARRPQLQCPMRTPGVVVGGVRDKHPVQVPLAEDQHAVGDLGPHCQDEAFGEAVRPRTPRRDLDHLDPCVRQDRIERGRELSGPIAYEEPKPGDVVAEVHDEVAGLLGGPRPVGCPVTPARVGSGRTSKTNKTQRPPQRERAVDVEKSTASMVVAWVRRNCRQLVSLRRDGAGRIRWRCRIRRIVEAPTRWPSLSSSPWSRVPPERVLSRYRHHQGGEYIVDRWPPGTVRVGPAALVAATRPRARLFLGWPPEYAAGLRGGLVDGPPAPGSGWPGRPPLRRVVGDLPAVS